MMPNMQLIELVEFVNPLLTFISYYFFTILNLKGLKGIVFKKLLVIILNNDAGKKSTQELAVPIYKNCESEIIRGA